MGIFRDRVAEEICNRLNGPGSWEAQPPEYKEAYSEEAWAHFVAWVYDRPQIPKPLQRRLDEIAVELGFADADTAIAQEMA